MAKLDKIIERTAVRQGRGKSDFSRFPTNPPVRQMILDYVFSIPGCNASEIVRSLGIRNRTTVRYHLEMLQRLGKVESKEAVVMVGGKGGSTRPQKVVLYYPIGSYYEI